MPSGGSGSADIRRTCRVVQLHRHAWWPWCPPHASMRVRDLALAGLMAPGLHEHACVSSSPSWLGPVQLWYLRMVHRLYAIPCYAIL